MQLKHPQLYKKLVFKGKLTLRTGLRVGASKETTEIGNVDLPVVRRVDTGEPYIPGSSIKGKLRSLLRLSQGKIDNNYTDEAEAQNCPILGLMGGAGDKGHGSRLVIRDARLTTEWALRLKESEATDMPYTEVKWENSINIITGVAEHPRQIERIPAGAEFDLQWIINVVGEKGSSPQDVIQIQQRLVETMETALNLLKYDYLGGMGSRGYGQVEIHDISMHELSAENDWTLPS